MNGLFLNIMKKVVLSSTIQEIFDQWPQTIGIFLQYRMSCPGCFLSYFEELEDALRVYDIPKQPFLEELYQVLQQQNEISDHGER
jgi:hybrid cluster-associated redox disulfide protein